MERIIAGEAKAKEVSEQEIRDSCTRGNALGTIGVGCEPGVLK